MTHYAALSEAVTRKSAGQGRSLTFRWSDVPVRELIEHLADGGELNSFLDSHPSAKKYHVRLVKMIWDNIRPEAETWEGAWRQLRQQADWALVSEVVSRRIAVEPVGLSDPPTESQFVSLVRNATEEMDVGSEGPRTVKPSDGSPRERRERGDAQHHACPGASKEATDLLTDAVLSLDDAVDQLGRANHPALSSYAQLLTNRIDEILAEVRDRPKAN